MNVVWNQTETSMFLNNTVAIKLMHGHMIQTIIQEMARVITIGRSVGCTKRKASLCAKESTTSSSKKKATGHMIIISWKASKKTWFVINGIKLSEQMPKTSLISKSERSFYFFY